MSRNFGIEGSFKAGYRLFWFETQAAEIGPDKAPLGRKKHIQLEYS